MNNRIRKKLYAKFLSEVGIEVTQNNSWQSRLCKLGVDETISIRNGDLPNSFYELNPLASKYKLDYELKKIELNAIPDNESSWWETDEKTTYFVFYPLAFRKVCWYVAVNF